MPVNTNPDIHELIICANIFVRKDDKFLLIKRSPHKKYAPNYVNPIGGKVDLLENPYTAAKREVFEEAGVHVKNMRLESVRFEVTPVAGEPWNWMIFDFSADYESGEVIETEEGELIWYTAEEIKQQDLFPSLREIIDNILNPHDGTVFATFNYDESGVKTYPIDLCEIS
jgi:8-oxo-dGTP diphosphatase